MMPLPAVCLLSRDPALRAILAQAAPLVPCRITDSPQEDDAAQIVDLSSAESASPQAITLGIGGEFVPPFPLTDLLARVRQVMAAARREVPVQINDALHYLPATRTVTHAPSRKSERLTESEAAILETLFLNPAGLARDDLMQRTLGYAASSETHTLENHIYRLRAKLREIAPENDLIQASDNGYRLAHG